MQAPLTTKSYITLIACLFSLSIWAQTENDSTSTILISEMSRINKHEMLRCPVHQKNMSLNSQFSMHKTSPVASDTYPFSIYNHLRRYCLPCSRKHRVTLRKSSSKTSE